MKRNPSIAIIASTMRSGSTLMKALLAEADDVINLPETNFQKQAVVDRILKQHTEDQPPIKVLKKPCWYQETKTYPRLPQCENLKVIALVRDMYDTVTSLRKMTFRWLAGMAAPVVTSWLARSYWVRVTRSLIHMAEDRPGDICLVRYEDVVARPIEVTASLYKFIGSERESGTKSYSAPEGYSWKWGSDDGSQNIRSLEVQPPRKKNRDEKRLVQLMENDENITALRERLGYLSGDHA